MGRGSRRGWEGEEGRGGGGGERRGRRGGRRRGEGEGGGEEEEEEKDEGRTRGGEGGEEKGGLFCRPNKLNSFHTIGVERLPVWRTHRQGHSQRHVLEYGGLKHHGVLTTLYVLTVCIYVQWYVPGEDRGYVTVGVCYCRGHYCRVHYCRVHYCRGTLL